MRFTIPLSVKSIVDSPDEVEPVFSTEHDIVPTNSNAADMTLATMDMTLFVILISNTSTYILDRTDKERQFAFTVDKHEYERPVETYLF